MGNVKGHVWYSTSSDETATRLIEKLHYPGGRKAPAWSGCDILVNWGCRPKSDWSPADLNARITKGEVRVLNHPTHAGNARNKLDLLTRLHNASVATPGFADLTGMEADNTGARVNFVQEMLKAGKLTWPLLCLNAMNRGQPAFCYNYDELAHAFEQAVSSDKAIDYVRSLSDGTEYRIHVFRDTVLAAQKKVLAKDPVGTVAEALQKKVERQRCRAKDDEEKPVAKSLKTADVKELVGFLAEELLLGPTHYQRSLGRGCELQDVPPKQLSKATTAVAIRAVDALHLDMGAVHVQESGAENGVSLVTNVITNPGLGGKLLNAYAKAIEDFAGGKGAEKQIPPATDDEKARPELVAALHRKIDALTPKGLEGLMGKILSKE
jgi:hypothetical protein